MRIVVVGASGMLGQDLLSVLFEHKYSPVGLDRPEIDITDPGSCAAALESAAPDVVINCAAWTAVDDAETHELDAFRVNAVGACNLAREATKLGARVVQISTDYVFRGDASMPWRENGTIDPSSAYGRTKAAGEWAVRSECPGALIVRTAWLYGAHGSCFPKAVASVLRSRGSMAVVADQYGQPTWTLDLSDLLVRLLEADAPGGIYHGTSGGQTSWYEFARQIAPQAGFDVNAIAPTTSAEFVRPAPRPAYSVLAHETLNEIGVRPIGDWAERWLSAVGQVLDN